MNTIRFKEWLETRQVLVILLAVGMIMLLVISLLLAPLNSRRNRLEKDIAAMRTRLAINNYLLGVDVLQEKKKEEVLRKTTLHDEWRQMVARISTFSKADEAPNIGHIDFKVALFDVRQHLRERSKTLNITLPYDLGMDDTVQSDEDSRKLMLELRAVERLVYLALNMKIVVLRNIAPLPPVQHTVERTLFLEEYPVRLEFSGNMKNLYDLLRGMTEPKSTFALKHIRIEPESHSRNDTLNVTIVASSLVFLKDPDEMPLTLQVQTGNRAPKGH
jgi:hypothetical protein